MAGNSDPLTPRAKIAVTAGKVIYQGGSVVSNTARAGNGGSAAFKGTGGDGGNADGGGIFVAANATVDLIDAAIGGLFAGNSAIGGSAGSGGFLGTNGANGVPGTSVARPTSIRFRCFVDGIGPVRSSRSTSQCDGTQRAGRRPETSFT